MSHPQPLKVAAWEEARLAAEQITDRNGKGIDPRIKETVIALMVYGFPTVQSCEGHLDWGLPYPWVEIRAPEPVGRREDEQKEQQWEHENLTYQQKMLSLLSQFYEQRRTPFDAQLSLDPYGFGAFRLRSIGGEILVLLTPDEVKAKLALYQKEMNDFTAFLKKRDFPGG